MTLFVKYFNLYLPTGREVSTFGGLLTFTAESLVCGMKLFTAEHKKVRIRTKHFFVKI